MALPCIRPSQIWDGAGPGGTWAPSSPSPTLAPTLLGVTQSESPTSTRSLGRSAAMGGGFSVPK